ncbi:MAG: LA2681 family HEPN domain-containing protein [Candidatus Aminicenantes bacterium]|jgi:tetratricopeptide (TPR) repeat protein
MDTEKLNELLKQAEEKYASGDYKEAHRLAIKVSELGEGPLISYYAGGILIDTGWILRDEEIVKKAVENLERDLKELEKRKDIAPSVYYNLANGCWTLYNFKRFKDPTACYLKPSELYKVRKYLLKAIELKPKGKKFLAQIWTNLGNCFDYLGRVVDALECYEMALKYKPDHGMAMGNKGIAFFYYANVTGSHQETFLYESYSLISDAIKLGVDPGTANDFQVYLNSLEKFFAGSEMLETQISFPGCKAESADKFEKFLISFCLKNRLYLNICNACQKCDNAIGDTVGIKSMIVSLKSSDGKLEPFYALANHLNHIKQDYVTARFLLVQSQYKELNLDFVNRKLKLTDTLDYSLHNIRIQLIKTAFRAFYDVLDKTSIFINNYLDLGIPVDKVYFRNVWFSDYNKKREKIHEKMKGMKNFALNAIYDIFHEFEKNGRYNRLRSTRNALTHRFVNIRLMQENEDEENMSEGALFEQTVELARIARNVIIYLMNMVNLEEKAKEEKIGHKLPQIESFEYPNELRP